jgi:hypothetical protein
MHSLRSPATATLGQQSLSCKHLVPRCRPLQSADLDENQRRLIMAYRPTRASNEEQLALMLLQLSPGIDHGFTLR